MDYLEKADEGDIRPLLRFYFQLLVTDYIKVVSEVFMQEQEKFSSTSKNETDEGEITGSELIEYFEVLRWFFGLLGELYGGVDMFGEMSDLMNALTTNGDISLNLK